MNFANRMQRFSVSYITAINFARPAWFNHFNLFISARMFTWMFECGPARIENSSNFVVYFYIFLAANNVVTGPMLL